MYLARLICSDGDCAERIVAEADDVLDLVSMACECGCTFEVLGLPDWIDDGEAATIVELRPRRGDSSGRLAA
jgi:hypothetical protein